MPLSTDYPLQLPEQLREHLRSLREQRGLTQAALGRLLGLSQGRIAEIELNPSVVSVQQLMRVLAALRAGLVLRDEGDEPATPPKARGNSSSGSKPVVKKGSW